MCVRFKSRKVPVCFVMSAVNLSVCLSVCLHVSLRLPTEGFSRNFLLETFTKICGETPVLVKIGQQYRALYLKTQVCVILFAATRCIQRNSTKKSRLCLHDEAQNIYYIVHSDMCTSTIKREGTFAFPWQHTLSAFFQIQRNTSLNFLTCIIYNYVFIFANIWKTECIFIQKQTISLSNLLNNAAQFTGSRSVQLKAKLL